MTPPIDLHAESPPVIPRGEPVWYIAQQFPYQGEWTAEQYFEHFPDHGYEFVDGFVENLPAATKPHQRMAAWLHRLLFDLAEENDIPGEAFLMGYRAFTIEEKYREPDVLFLFDERESSDRNSVGFDIGVEIVSDAPSDRARDLVTKREEYAAAGVPEYWIVDYRERAVLLLTISGEEYAETAGREGDVLESVVLPGLRVDISQLFAAAGGRSK